VLSYSNSHVDDFIDVKESVVVFVEIFEVVLTLVVIGHDNGPNELLNLIL
jgi:hypothetical protein